jgi:hypothetical protein
LIFRFPDLNNDELTIFKQRRNSHCNR